MVTPMHNAQRLLEKILSLPTDRIAEVEDFVDFLRARATARKTNDKEPLNFPVDNLGPWPEGLRSLHRENMYGDDGR